MTCNSQQTKSTLFEQGLVPNHHHSLLLLLVPVSNQRLASLDPKMTNRLAPARTPPLVQDYTCNDPFRTHAALPQRITSDVEVGVSVGGLKSYRKGHAPHLRCTSRGSRSSRDGTRYPGRHDGDHHRRHGHLPVAGPKRGRADGVDGGVARHGRGL